MLRVSTNASLAMGQLGFPGAWRVFLLPKLKVLQAVIVSHAVKVVNNLGRKQIPSEILFHHKAVFKNVAFRHVARMIRGINQNVTLVGPTPTSLPVWRIFHSSRWSGFWRMPTVASNRDASISEVIPNSSITDTKLTSETRDRIRFFVKLLQFCNRHGELWFAPTTKNNIRISVPFHTLVVLTAHVFNIAERLTGYNRTIQITPRSFIIAQV